MVKLHAQVLSDLVIHLWGIQDPSHYSMAPEMWQAPLSISGNSLWSNMESAGKSMKIHHPPSCWWYPWLLDLTCELIECIVQHPWRIHGAAIYMVTWIPSIYPSHVSIYIYIPAPWIRHGILQKIAISLTKIFPWNQQTFDFCTDPLPWKPHARRHGGLPPYFESWPVAL